MSNEARAMPDTFPAGTKFFDHEGSPWVMVPGEGWFCGFGGALAPKASPDWPLGSFDWISEDEFRSLALATARARR